ncbi:MAG: autotransporter-associated beta strand repeat-containing protein, partial [Gluconobacter oxydans]|uniref:autotransporter-associated beta strand repeat-containing protein n=1 Tax=Gluconobacter oxydans TaxID=442 RepID=UPI0039E7D9B6
MADGTKVGFGVTGLSLSNKFFLNGDPTFDVDGTQSDTISGVITDGSTSGDLVKTGTGTLTLTGVDAGTGTMSVDAGTLVLGEGFTPAGRMVDVASGATLDTSAAYVSETSLSGAGMLNVGTKTLSLSNASGTFSGVVSGSGELRVAEGIETLSGVQASQAMLGVDAGAYLDIAGAVSALMLGGAGTFVLTDGSDLTLKGNGYFAGDIAGAGALTVEGVSLALQGNNNWSGATNIASGSSLQIMDTKDHAASFSGSSLIHDDGIFLMGNISDLSHNSTLSSTLDGSGTLEIVGGTVRFEGLNLLTGESSPYDGTSLFVDDATVITNSGGLGSGGVVIVGSTLDLEQASDGSVSNVITDMAAYDASYAGTVIKGGSGLITMSGDNAYTGGTTINQGGLAAGTDTAFGTGAVTMAEGTEVAFAADGLTLANKFILNGDPTFDVGGSQTDTVSGAITDGGTPGDLVKTGTGTLSLTGANSYTGTTEVAAGTLRVDDDSSAATGALTVDGGAALGGTGTVGGSVTVQSGATLTPGDAGAGTLTIGGSLTLADGSTTQYDLGQPGVAGGAQNDLVEVGGDLILGGTLNVTADPASGTALPAGVYRLFDYGGSLSGSEAIGTVVLAGGDAAGLQTSVTGQVNLVVASMSTSFWNGGNSDNGVLTGGSGTWKAGGPGWTDISAVANGSWNTGASAVFEGLAGNVAVDDSAGNVSVGSMQFANADGQSYVLSGDTLYAAGQTLGINVGDGTAAGAGIRAEIDSTIDDSHMAGGAQLVKSGLGTLVLGGANAYTGGTTIQSGTVAITDGAALGTGAVQDDAALTLALGADGTVANAISGTGTIEKTGSSSVTLTGADTGTGAMTVDAGKLALGADAGPAGRVVSVAAGATLDTSAGDMAAVSLAGAGTLNVGAETLTLSRAAGTFAGDVAGTGMLDVAGGTETLSGVQAGQAALGVAAGADLDITGAVSARALAGAGSVALADGSVLTLKGDGSFAGDIAGAGALSIEGQQTLTGENTFTGGTDITSGAGLTVADTATHAAGLAGAVTDDGSLTVDNSTDPTHSTTLAGDITGAGVVIAKDGALALAGANSFSGGLHGENAAITATTASLGTGGVALDGGSLTLAQDTDGATADAISGTGSLIKTGRGTLTLAAASSYTGGTAIQSGTVEVTDAGALGTGAVQDDAALTLALASDGTVANAISGTGTIEKTGSSSVTLTGTNSYSGGTTISGGTLSGTTGALGTGQITDNAALDIDGTGSLANTVTGTGSLTKTGAGDLALTGANTFTGGLDIASGSVTAAVPGLGAGAIRDDGGLIVQQDTTAAIAADITGTGHLTKEGTGTLSLTGANSYSGTTEVVAGTLRVDDDSSAATGALTVDGGAALGGGGTIGGAVMV